MNNGIFFSPYDSLGRRIGVINNFGSFSDNQLFLMKSELGLFMDIEMLKFLRGRIKTANANRILLEEVYLLDEIAKASADRSDNALIHDFFTESGELAEVYRDLLQKRAATAGNTAPMMSFCDLASVYSRYSDLLGITQNAHGYSESKQQSFCDAAFVYLYPSESCGDYAESAGKLFESDEYKRLCATEKQIDVRGIAFALASFGTGIYADLHSLPELNATPELSHLATAAHGRYIIATKKEATLYLDRLAQAFSLKCVYFARGVKSDKFTLRKIGRTQMELDMSLILAFANFKKKDAFKCDVKDYNKAISDCVDAIVPAVTYGASLQSITLEASYKLPLICSQGNEKSRFISAVLGAYRLSAELCIGAGTPKVEFTDECGIEASFSAKTPASPLSDISNVRTDAYLYLLSFNKKENGEPDLASLRGMCNKIKALADSKSILYSLAVTKDISSAIGELVRYVNVGIYKNLPIRLDEKLSGILVISPLKLENAMLIGMVKPPVSTPCASVQTENIK